MISRTVSIITAPGTAVLTLMLAGCGAGRSSKRPDWMQRDEQRRLTIKQAEHKFLTAICASTLDRDKDGLADSCDDNRNGELDEYEPGYGERYLCPATPPTEPYDRNPICDKYPDLYPDFPNEAPDW
jgi:hypothetical protein